MKEGGNEATMKVYKNLLKSGYKATPLKNENGYKLVKGSETIIARGSKSGNTIGKKIDTFTKKINGENISVFFKSE